MADNKLSAQVTIDTKQATTALAGLNKSVKGSAEVLQKLRPSAASGGAALTSLSRIAQDAPFGFIAIQNNVTELFSTFGQLSKSTGGAGSALKALGASMLGPGGVLVALSAVTSAITYGVQKYGSLENALLNLTGQLTNAAIANNKLGETYAAAAGNAAGEVAAIKALYSIATDETNSRKQRTEAINRLNKEYDTYLPNLDLENIKTDKVREAVDNLTKSLVRQAQIKGLQDLIGDETKKQFEALNKTALESATTFQKFKAVLNGLATKNTGNAIGQLFGQGQKEQKQALDDTKSNIDKYTKLLNDLLDVDTQIGEVTKPKKGIAKKIKDAIEKTLESDNKIRFTPEIFTSQGGVEIETGLKKLNSFVQQAIDTTAATRTFTIPSNVIIKPIKLEKAISDLNRQLTESINTFGVEGFAGIGEVIGAAIAGGSGAIEDAARNLGMMFGNFLKGLGKIMIQAAVQMQAVKVALASLNPAVALAAGIALTALGSIVTSKLQATKFATGGIVTGPTLGMVGEAGQPEVILPLSKINQFLSGEGQGNGGALTLSVSGDVFTFGLARNARKQARLY